MGTVHISCAYIYTYWQELSSAPLSIHTVVHLYILPGTVISLITPTYSYTFYLLVGTVICPIKHTYSYWQELSSAPLCLHTVIHLYIGRNCHPSLTHTYSHTIVDRNCRLPDYTYIQLAHKRLSIYNHQWLVHNLRSLDKCFLYSLLSYSHFIVSDNTCTKVTNKFLSSNIKAIT